MKLIFVILGLVAAIAQSKTAEIPVDSNVINQNSDDETRDEFKFEFQFDAPNGTFADPVQSMFVQYDTLMSSLRRKSNGILQGYGSSLNKTRDQVTAGMYAAVQPFLDWAKTAVKKYPELHTSAKLQEFTALITTFTESSNQTIRAFTESFYMNIESTSNVAYDTFHKKGNEVLRDVLNIPTTSSVSQRCKNNQLNKFGSLGNAAFRQVDGCITSEAKLQRRIQSSSEIGLRNMRSYIRGIVDKLNFCYIREYYEHPTQCIEKEV